MNNKPKILGNNVKIHPSVKFGINVIIYDNVEIGEQTIISHNCIIGDSDIKLYKSKNHQSKKTIIGKNSFIRPYTMISEDVQIGDNFQCGDKVMMRKNTRIGNDCSIGTMCDLQGNIVIGNNVRFHSNVHIGMKTVIKNNVWIYPYVVVTNDPNPPKGELLSTTIESYSQIASNSVLMPGITIGESSFVGANSLVVKSVEKETLVYGSPAKSICSVREVKDIHGNSYLPWQEFIGENK